MVLPQLPDRFESVEPLASTPIERSFRAFDRVLQREVVVRLPAVAAWAGWSAPVRERLLREARALAKVEHDGVLPILWVEETPEGPLLVQPPAAGERLGERLRHGVLGVDETVTIGVQLASALAAVHYCGIVHRGVGPDAVWLLPDARVRLGSFTFAKAFDVRLPSSIDHGRRQDPADAALLPPYPAPEQLAGRGADPRVDVWATGCLLFRCLCGEDPVRAAGDGPMPDVRSRRSDVPKPVAEVLRRCTQLAPTARYPTAQSMGEALAALREPRPARGVSRRTAVGAVAAGVAVLGGLGVWRPWAAPEVQRSRPQVEASGRATPLYTDHYERGHALLIGIATEYAHGPHPTLVGPVNEIKAVRERLMQNDPRLFTNESVCVLSEERATAKAILDALEQLKDDAQPNDAVLVYFAGHGVRKQRSHNHWLVAADAKQSVPDGDASGFVERQALFDLAGFCEAKHVLVVLDCCYAGQVVAEPADAEPGDKGKPLDALDDGKNLRRHRYLSSRARQYLMSSSRGETAKDAGTTGLSVFCQAFLDTLDASKNNRSYVTAGMLMEFIAMSMQSQSYQLPQFKNLGDPEGSFVFFLPPPK